MTTQKIRIKRSELDRLSDEDLRALAKNVVKIEEANKNKRAEFYLERMTHVQEEMHKSNARFLCVWAGNRCLRGDQRIFTKRGLVAIRDIQENDEVMSFDQVSNQFRYNRSSAAILKGSDRLIRVVHEAGEFVAHEKHMILCYDGQYRDLSDLNVGDAIIFTDFNKLTSRVCEISNLEKLQESEDFYDIQVNIDHNYVTEDGAIHHNSGKSTGAIMELRWRVLGDHPFKKCKVPIKALLVCTDFENHVKKVIEPKIAEWFPPAELAKATIERNQSKAIKQIRFQNGSIIDILSHDQDPMIFESSDTDLVIFDEPPPQQIFKAVWRGLTDRGGSAIIAGTPIVQAWMIQEYKKWQGGNTDGLHRHFILGKTEDNAANLGDGDRELGMKRIAEFAAMLSPEEREARLNGMPLELQGLVFKAWSRDTHMVKPFDWPHDWPIIESIDPHPRKPAGCSWIGLAPNGSKILLSSGYLEGDVVELADEILRYRESLPIKDGRKPRIIRTLIDNSANAPLTGRSISNMVRDRVTVREELENIIGPRGAGGPRIESPPKSVSGKIESLKAWLTVRERGGRVRPDFFVMDTPDNENFVKEIEGYVWAKFKNRERAGYKDQPIKKDDDILDSVLQVALTQKAHDEKESEIANIFKSRDTYISRGALHGRQ